MQPRFFIRSTSHTRHLTRISLSFNSSYQLRTAASKANGSESTKNGDALPTTHAFDTASRLYRFRSRLNAKSTHMSMMQKWVIAICGALVIYVLFSIERSPVTGRWRLLLLPDSLIQMLSEYEFEELKNSSVVLPENHGYSIMLKRVGKRIAAAVGPNVNYEWEFVVIDDPQCNAFCLPGGRVVFFTGLLQLFDTEDEVAAIMGHEVAHALLRHGAEGATIQTVLKTISFVLLWFGNYFSVPVNQYLPNILQLANSRNLEYEADLIGIMLMSRACYDSQYAILAMQKLERSEKAQVGLDPTQQTEPKVGLDRVVSDAGEYLQTHPHTDKRIARLRELQRAALKQRQLFCLVNGNGSRPEIENWFDGLEEEVSKHFQQQQGKEP